MKKIMMLLLVTLVLGSQMVFGQLGGWFKWSDPDYVPSSFQYGDIIDLVNNGLINKEKDYWYPFGNGVKFQILHPIEWRDLMLECYQSDDPTVTKENLSKKVGLSEDIVWSDDISCKTKNFYWSKSGKIEFVPEYSGYEKKVPISVSKGKPRIKRNCGNPQGNYILIEKIVEVEKPQPKPEPAPEPKPKAPPIEISQDTIIRRNTEIEENLYVTRNRYDYDDGIYGQMQSNCWVTPLLWDLLGNRYYGQPQMVDNRTFNYFNSQTSNYVCERSNSKPIYTEPPHAGGPGGRGDENQPHAGGPGGRGDGATGGNTSGSGGREDNTNHATGDGGRSSSTRDGNYVSGQETYLKSGSVNSRTRSTGKARVYTSESLALKSASTNSNRNTSRTSSSTGNSRTNYSGNSRQSSYGGGTGSNYRTNYNTGGSLRSSSASYRPSYNSGASRSYNASASRQPSYGGQSSSGGGSSSRQYSRGGSLSSGGTSYGGRR